MLLDYTQNCTMVVFDGWSTNICKKIVQKYLQKYNQNICKKILPKYLEKYYQNAKQILMMIGEGVRGGLIWTGSAQNCTNTNHATRNWTTHRQRARWLGKVNEKCQVLPAQNKYWLELNSGNNGWSNAPGLEPTGTEWEKIQILLQSIKGGGQQGR